MVTAVVTARLGMRATKPSGRQTALLVLLARPAWARIVAADLGAGAHVGGRAVVVVMVVAMPVIMAMVVMVIVSAAAAIVMGMIVAVVVCWLSRISAHVRHTSGAWAAILYAKWETLMHTVSRTP